MSFWSRRTRLIARLEADGTDKDPVAWRGMHIALRLYEASRQGPELSEERAQTVSGTLIASGVEPKRLVATGYGETLPVASNTSERGRSLNRRVAILLKAKAK